MQIIGRIVVHIILVYSLFDHVVRNGCKRRAVVQFLRDDDATALHAQRFECPVLVQTDDDGRALHLIGVAVTGEDQRGIAVQVSRGGRAVVVPLIMQRAVKIDAGTRVREQILFGNSALHRNGDTLNVTGSQAGLRHIQKIFIRSVFGLIILLQKRLCSVQLFAGGLFLVGHIFAPAGVEVEEFSVLAALIAPVPVAVIPFAKQLRAVGVYRLAAGTGGPARERVAFAAQRAGRQVNGLVKRGALVFHAACHVSAVGVVADHVAEAVPLRLERHAAVTVGAEVIGGRHAVAQRAVRQHDVPVVIPLSAGEFGAVQRGKHRMAVFVNVGVQNGFLIAIAVKMNGQIGLLGLPERVERGVRRQLDCRAVVIDLFACGQKRPAREAEARFRKGVGRQRALAPGQRLRVHRALAAVRVEGDGDILHSLVDPVDDEGDAAAGDFLCVIIGLIQRIDLIAEGAVGIPDIPAAKVLAGGEAAAAELQQIVRYGFQLRVHGGSPPGIHAAEVAAIAVAVQRDIEPFGPLGVEGNGAIVDHLLRDAGRNDILARNIVLFRDGLAALRERPPASEGVAYAVLCAGRRGGNGILVTDCAGRIVNFGSVRIVCVKMRRQVMSGPLRIERGVRRGSDIRAVGIAVAGAVRRSVPAEEFYVSAVLLAGEFPAVYVGEGVCVQRRRRTGRNNLRGHCAGNRSLGVGLIAVKGNGDVLCGKVGAADVLQRHCAGRHEIFFRVEIDLENVACFYIHVVRTCEFIAAGALCDCSPVKTQLGVAVGRTVTDGEQMLEPEVAVFLERKRQNRVRVLIQLAAVLVEDGHTGSVVAGVPCRGLIRCRKRRCGHGEIVAEVVGPGRFRRVILCKDRCVGVKGVACCEDLCGQKAQKHDQHKHDG